MIISGQIEAHKALIDGVETPDILNVTLPDLESKVLEISGAGIAGSFEMGSSMFGATKISLATRSLNKLSGVLYKSGKRELEIRAALAYKEDGQDRTAAIKIFATGHFTKRSGGKIENAASNEGSADFECMRYRLIVDGKEVILLDKINFIFKVNGEDQYKDIRAALS